MVAIPKPPYGHSTACAAWFCVRSQPRHERIAAASLRQQGITDLFVPRIRYRRPARRGATWVTEALFPGYLFARFDWEKSFRLVQHALGVSGIVHFGPHWPVIPENTVNELRAAVGPDELRVVPETLCPGDRVRITGGTFDGLEGVVTQVMSGQERVAVLMDFLGRQTTFQINTQAVIKENEDRWSVS